MKMKPSNLHILLTYNCSLKCKHCYVFSSPRALGKMSISQISRILDQAQNLDHLDLIYYGGGEPFTQYPILLKAVNYARKRGFNVGVETNGYFARSVDSGIRYLRPLVDMGVSEICISNDYLHYKDPGVSPAKRAIEAAQILGLSTKIADISLTGTSNTNNNFKTSIEVMNPRLMFIGRAADTLFEDQPVSGWNCFDRCPRDDLSDPENLFIDAYGFVQICPGIAIGNVWEHPLGKIIEEFDAGIHPILGALAAGGPTHLIQTLNIKPDQNYVDACHCCYSIRRKLFEQYPHLLAPRQVYGL